MEKIINPYDKESMKMAMLKHEETFKYQVYELHRLYRIQKLLMKNISEQKKKQEHEQDTKGSKKAGETSNEKQDFSSKEEIAESGDHRGIEDESELELTLGPSSYNRRRKAGENSDCSSSDSSHVKRKTSEKMQNNGIDVPEQFRQDRLKNPPWIFQFLSLNMT